jgi:ABC-type antimicrobial peptide transport system permease subunit
MSEFQLYFGLGKDHILDYANGYDHILFVIALCALYTFQDWKKILILVTAFTVGHSLTLALATLGVISVNARWVEFLIPLTIFTTAVSNLFRKESLVSGGSMQGNYFLALFFGLIHGMGFSNYLKALLGKNESIITQLFAFNVGLEFGQIIIVGIFLGVSFIALNLAGANRRDWKMVLSSAIAGIALILIKDRTPW